MLLKKVRSILEKECGFTENSKLIVGVSGGPDSICLFDLLTQLPYEFIVCHLNHKLRPSSDEEMAFVERLSLSSKIKFIGKTENVEAYAKINGVGIEESARILRYQFLFEAAQNEKADAVLVAHQADDQVETILLNLIRGAGFDGLSGMSVRAISEFHAVIPLVRPLLFSWRDEIMDYIFSHRLEYKLDESNFSVKNKRASIRNHLIPELNKYNPKIKNTLMRTSRIIADDIEFLNESVEIAYGKIGFENRNGVVSIELNEFQNLSKSLQRLMIKDILERHFNYQKIISFSNIEYIRKFFSGGIRKSNLKINEKTFALISGSKGLITSQLEKVWNQNWPKIEKELNLQIAEGTFPIGGGWQLRIDEITINELQEHYAINKDPFRAYFDNGTLAELLTIRPWVRGDRFEPLGMSGKSMKVADYWINRKLMAHARTSWPLFLCRQKIIWIPGFQQAHNTRITSETQNVLKMNLFRDSYESFND